MQPHFEKDWTANDAPLIWVEAIYVGDTKERKRLLGHEFGGHYFESKNQATSFYLNIETETTIAKIATQKYLDPEFLFNFLKITRKIDQNNIEIARKISSKSLDSLTNKELTARFSDFFQNYAQLAGVYRFMRPETYQNAILEIKKQLPDPKDENLGLFLENQFDKIPQKIAQKISRLGVLYKQIGEQRLKMHKTYVDTFLKAETFFSEIGKRIGLSALEVKNCTFQEIQDYLSKNSAPDKKKIQDRIKYFRFIYLEDNFKIGTEPAKIQESEAFKEIKEFKGQPAFPGKTQGKVRLISYRIGHSLEEEIRKFEPGEILVAITTSPDYIPAMEKAVGIITDEGGLLSHAAIISRELKIPCIVGTKIATKVLHDGDMIEVDANKGIVKIIEKG